MSQGKPIQLLTYSLLLSYSWSWAHSGMSLRAFNKTHNSRLTSQFGAQPQELLPWHVWRAGVMIFWEETLELSEKVCFQCPICGPRPPVLVIDGVAIGIMKERLHHQANMFVPFESSKIFDCPTFQDKMFIKSPA